MAMAERQSAHRESLEATVVAGNVASQARGSHYAFIICLITIVGGFVLIGILATLAGVFVIAKREQKRERIDKSNALEKRRRS